MPPPSSPQTKKAEPPPGATTQLCEALATALNLTTADTWAALLAATAAYTKHTTPTIDDCPRCANPVTAVTGSPDGRTAGYRAQPCGHPVTVTIWPTRIQLHLP